MTTSEMIASMENMVIAEDAPEYVKKRLETWFRIKADRSKQQEQSSDIPIRVTLPDGQVKVGVKGKTTPMDVVK